MNFTSGEKLVLGWIAVMSCWAFLAFGYDKWQAERKQARRVPEATLCLISALGGWAGGLLGLLLFRHKSAKTSFQLKFNAAFVVWTVLLVGAWQVVGRV